MDRKTETVAEALAVAWREGGSAAPLAAELHPTNFDESFQVQDALNRRLGFELAGWKIGVTSRAGKEKFGIDHPGAFGRVYRSITREHPARFRMSDFRNPPPLEGEFAFRLGRDLPPREEPYSEAEVRDAVSELIMAIDMVDTRWGVPPFELTPFQANADNGCAGGFVIGGVLEGWETLDVAGLPVNLYLDGELAGESWEGEQRCSLDELFAALHWGANHLSGRGLGFRAGQVVSTGSPHQPVPAMPGAEAVIRYGDLGEIRVTVEA